MGRHPKNNGSSLSGLGASSIAKKKRNLPEEFLEDSWDCPMCTFKNPRNSYKCRMCESPRGSSTRKSRVAEQIIQKQVQTQMLAKFGEGSKEALEEVRRKSLATANGHDDYESTHESGTESENESSEADEDDIRKNKRKKGKNEHSSDSDKPGSSKMKMMPKSKRPKNDSSDPDASSPAPPRPKKTLGRKGTATKGRGRPSKSRQELNRSDSSSESEEEDSDEPEPPKKKTKPPLKESKSTDKNEKIPRAPRIPQQKMFPKHRNIDKSTGVEYNISYAGTTVKFTEYKLRTTKPKPKSYPENGENQEIFENGVNGKLEESTHLNGKLSNETTNSNPVKNELNEADVKIETSTSVTKTGKTDDRFSTSITTANPNLGSVKKTSVPNYEDKPSNTKPNFGEQFKNAFKNTNPKNSANQKSEISKQIETKNNISQSLKKSLNINTDDKSLDSEKNQNENSNNGDLPSKPLLKPGPSATGSSQGPNGSMPPSPISSSRPASSPADTGGLRPPPQSPRYGQPNANVRPRSGNTLLKQGVAIGNPVQIRKIGAPVTIRKGQPGAALGPNGSSGAVPGTSAPPGPPTLHRPKPLTPQHPLQHPSPSTMANPRGPPPAHKSKPYPGGPLTHGHSSTSFRPNPRTPKDGPPLYQPHRHPGLPPTQRETRPLSHTSVPSPTSTDGKKIGRNPVGPPKMSGAPTSGPPFRPISKPRGPTGSTGPLDHSRPPGPIRHGTKSPQSSPVNNRNGARQPLRPNPGTSHIRPPHLTRPPARPPSAQISRFMPPGGPRAGPMTSGPRPTGPSGPRASGPPRMHSSGQPGPRVTGQSGMPRQLGPRPGPQPQRHIPPRGPSGPGQRPIRPGSHGNRPPRPQTKAGPDSGLIQKPITGYGMAIGRPVSVKTLKKTNGTQGGSNKGGPSPTPQQQPGQTPSIENSGKSSTSPPAMPTSVTSSIEADNPISPKKIEKDKDCNSAVEKTGPTTSTPTKSDSTEKLSAPANPTSSSSSVQSTAPAAAALAAVEEEDDSDEEKSLQIDESGSSLAA